MILLISAMCQRRKIVSCFLVRRILIAMGFAISFAVAVPFAAVFTPNNLAFIYPDRCFIGRDGWCVQAHAIEIIDGNWLSSLLVC
jgi:hypothetical protein